MTLIQVTDKVRDKIDRGYYACWNLKGLQKAFDTVDHNILLKKLQYFRMSGNSNK